MLTHSVTLTDHARTHLTPPTLPNSCTYKNVCKLYNPTCTDPHLHTLYSTVTHKTHMHWPTSRILSPGRFCFHWSICSFSMYCNLRSWNCTLTILCGTHTQQSEHSQRRQSQSTLITVITNDVNLLAPPLMELHFDYTLWDTQQGEHSQRCQSQSSFISHN